jgi:ribosomal protein L14
MIQIGSILTVLDNSGPFEARCINVLKNKSHASFGDQVVLAIQSVKSNSRILAGTVQIGLIVQTRKSLVFPDGSRLAQKHNGVVLLNSRKDLLASRINAPIVLFSKDSNSDLLVPKVSQNSYRLFYKLRILSTSSV